jgi:hypothetical protein
MSCATVSRAAVSRATVSRAAVSCATVSRAAVSYATKSLTKGRGRSMRLAVDRRQKLRECCHLLFLIALVLE